MRVIETELNVTAAQPIAIVVRKPWQKSLLTFLMVFGPGLIVMEADNDAGAVSTYMQAGGQYGLHLLWLLVVLLPICYFVQEMVARLGIATGKGHAAMIYERFGKWWGRFSLIDLLAVNFLTLITEFAAISLALRRTPQLDQCRAQHNHADDASRWDHKQPGFPGHRYRGHHNRSLAALFSAELCGGKAAAVLRSQVGTVGYADRRSVQGLRGWRHDVGWQLRI